MKLFYLFTLLFIASIIFIGCGDDPTFYTVTFNSQGGSEVSSQTVEQGGKVTKPTDPTRDGYIFVAWYKETTSTNEWNFDTDVVTNNITLFAKWNEEDADLPPITVENEESLTQEVLADAKQGASDVIFTTTGAWTSSISVAETKTKTETETTAADWISISPESGDAGTHTIEITLEPNFTGEDRTAIITITSGEAAIEINITQKGAKQKMTIAAVSEVHFKIVGSGRMTIDWDDGFPNETYTLSPDTNYISRTHTRANRSSETSVRNITIIGEDITGLEPIGSGSQLAVIAELDVSQNSELTFLRVRDNRLTELDVSRNTALTHLFVEAYQLTSLDVSNNTALTSLSVYSALTSLDVSNNTALTHLYVSTPQLTSLDVSRNTALTHLSVGNALSITSLDVSNNTALTYLFVSNARLVTSLDVSNKTALTYLNVSNAQLITSLDVSNNTALTYLNVNNALLITSLDVSNNTALTHLDVNNAPLITSLDVSSNTALTSLSVGTALSITSLDVSNNTALTSLSVGSAPLITSLDVSNSTALTSLSVTNAPLTSLDVSSNTALTSLSVIRSQLTNLDVSNNTALTSLTLGDNQLTNLDVSNNTALTILNVNNNQFTADALNDLFDTLHSNAGTKTISERGNPGSSESNRGIAFEKGWRVQ
ncbi:MAG: InlB B-repeat-containing protein [Dysgonamonadaceae bacterium]|nr:InlB B-repeat-containing protein [Dysgonamonadaceae bacterium]